MLLLYIREFCPIRLWNYAVWRAVATILRSFIPCRWSSVTSFEVFFYLPDYTMSTQYP